MLDDWYYNSERTFSEGVAEGEEKGKEKIVKWLEKNWTNYFDAFAETFQGEAMINDIKKL